MTRPELLEKYMTSALSMRRDILELAHSGGGNGAHIAPALSIVEIMAVIYLHAMNHGPDGGDIFVLSTGPGALAYYAALQAAGLISREQLFEYEVDGGPLPGQPSKNLSLGIAYSGGSLGLGLSFACGLAFASRMRGDGARVFVLMGDGELDEGSVWESALFAGHHKLSNIIAVVDRNSMQSDGSTGQILDIDAESLWRSSGWHVKVCDGHDVGSLVDSFDEIPRGAPCVIIANTVKGKGVSFMENNNDWHHNRLSEEQLNDALRELDGLKC
ncbi:MAG: transketolase [Synergistaceae bacterium]|jgi:transketolase|nr:transketolase [Synergistaceae bacterium]